MAHRTQFRGNASKANELERLLHQHHVDIQRLWKRLGQAPQETLGDNPWADSPYITGGASLIIGKPTALVQFGNFATFTIWSGTKGSETSTGTTISAYVRSGLVFQDKFYQCLGVGSDYEIIDPATEFVSVSSGAISTGGTGTTLIYVGSGGSETSSGQSASYINSYGDIATGKRMRIAWSKWFDGWEIVNALC